MVRSGSVARKARGPKPGDRVRIEFGTRTIEGVVTSVRGAHVHVEVQLDGADETIDRFVRQDALVLA